MGKKGQKVRPCYVCSMPVKFVFWEKESNRRGRRIFHWANEDGTHHIHKEKPEQETVEKVYSEPVRFVQPIQDPELPWS